MPKAKTDKLKELADYLLPGKVLNPEMLSDAADFLSERIPSVEERYEVSRHLRRAVYALRLLRGDFD